jgi:hypothetical protein
MGNTVVDLARAGLNFSWTMPLFGAQQLAYWLTPTAEHRQKATAGLDGVSRAAGGGLDPDVLGRVYQLGQCLEGAIVQMGPTLLTPKLLYPSTWINLSVDTAQRSAAATRQLAEGNGGLMLQELWYKEQVFCLVLNLPNLIGVPSEPPFPLNALIAKSYALGFYPALWALEGLGKEYADSFWKQGMVPHHILSDEQTSDVPIRSLTMLNAGIGLSFAQTCLENAEPSTPAPALDAIVAEIVRLTRDNARPGYFGATYENLGLVTRTFHPELVPAVDRSLRQVAPDVVGYFWHGVGRAIYFLPINFLPGADRFVFEMAAREAPDEPARLNAIAGAAWGFTVVLQPNPEILAELVVAPFGEELARTQGFANGVASSLMMRFDITPEAPFVRSYVQYRPSASNPRLVRLWDELVRVPAETALDVYYPVIKQHNRLGDIFEYQDLAAFVARLQRGKAA